MSKEDSNRHLPSGVLHSSLLSIHASLGCIDVIATPLRIVSTSLRSSWGTLAESPEQRAPIRLVLIPGGRQETLQGRRAQDRAGKLEPRVPTVNRGSLR